ncbi:MAG: type II toxin-antitoxin system VapC family toxin [Dissulfurispiraceae bacterium]|nr:type II toxin-antitoxin system VapC family toxin [Dissulfurispiraceae bacterium]
MKKILLDTNAYSGFMSGSQVVFDHIVESEIVYVSTVMLGELFAGFIGGKRYSENIYDLRRFLSKDGVNVINVSIETSEIFGEIKAGLAKSGNMIPMNDIWIAAHAVETGSKLLTFDTHFKKIKGLRLWNIL